MILMQNWHFRAQWRVIKRLSILWTWKDENWLASFEHPLQFTVLSTKQSKKSDTSVVENIIEKRRNSILEVSKYVSKEVSK